MDLEEMDDIIGTPVNLIESYKGWGFGHIVGLCGDKYIIQLSNGKEIVAYRDEFVIL